MTYSKGPWIYDAESGEIHTKDRTGFWGPDHEPVVVATVEQLEGANNGPLLAAAADLFEALCEAEEFISQFEGDDEFTNELTRMLTSIRAAIFKAEDEQ